jgi:glycosyltransferase involved in cell wall biosynthesis
MRQPTDCCCVHVIKNAQPESAAICRIVALLSEHVRPLGYRVSVVCLGAGGPLVAELEDAGAKVRIVPWTGVRSDFVLSRTFWWAMRAERPDIVHVHHGSRAVRLLSRLAGARAIVQHVHSRTIENQGVPINGVSFRSADAVIATSRAVASCLRGTSPVDVIYPGIQSPPYPLPVLSKGTLLLGVAGRLVPLKGIHILISAVAKLRKNGLAVCVQITGSGPQECALRKQIRELEMDDQFELIGWSSDLKTIRENWDIAVVPSLEEGFGLAALEAMGGGRAVIASRVGGLPELVIDGITGLLVTPGDVDALADGIAQLANERALLESMGIAGWRRAREQFSALEMAEKTAALYARLL